MTSQLGKSLLWTMLILGTVSCASRNDKAEIRKEAAASQVKDPKALGELIDQAINNSTHLTAEQKKELEKIIAGNKQKATALSEETYKYRSVLVQELLGETPKASRVKYIKKDIERVEKERLRNTFETIEAISKVVSKSSDRNRFTEALIFLDRPSR